MGRAALRIEVTAKDRKELQKLLSGGVQQVRVVLRALALLQLAADLGSPMSDGSFRIASLTHHTIAEFVGTSREIVTFQMNRLRRLGLVRYSRKHIDVYAEAMRDHLRKQGTSIPHGAEAAAQFVGV